MSLIMQIAGFEKKGATNWRRDHEEGYIDASVMPEGMILSLFPSIQSHTQEEHEANAGRAAILFKVAMTLAEMADGRIEQRSLIGNCHAEAKAAGILFATHNQSSILLAAYPDEPLLFQNLCAGFRRVLNRGVGQEPAA